MSAVLNQTKQMYQRVLAVETLCFALMIIGILWWQPMQAVSFAMGIATVFLPYVFSVLFMFFRSTRTTLPKITAFYRIEAFKFLMTALLMVVAIKYVVSEHIIAFFIGCFLTLVLNNVLPFLFSRAFFKAA